MNGSPDRLPCGADVDTLLDQVSRTGAALAGAHQTACPHCQAAVAELDALWGPVRELAAERVSAPPGLVTAVMRRVRDLARDGWHALTTDHGGTTRIAARVVAAIARLAAARVPGVHVALGRTTEPATASAVARATQTHSYPGSAVGVAGTRVVVELALATAYGRPIGAVADQVRRAVFADLSALTGLQAEVNLTVDDIIG